MNFLKINNKTIILILAGLFMIYNGMRLKEQISGERRINTGRYAVISINLDTNLDFYVFYLPITCLTWRLIDFEPIVLVVVSSKTETNKLAQKSLEYLAFFKFKVVCIQSVENYEKMTGMLSRLFVGLLDDKDLSENAFIFQTDADLIPMNKTYYNNFDKIDSIKIFDVSAFQTPIGQFDYKGKNYQMYFMGHIGMKKWQWRDLMKFKKDTKFNGESVINLVKEYYDNSRVRQNHEIQRGDDVWFLDQYIVSVNIARYIEEKKGVLYKNPSPGIKLDRIWTDEKWLSTLINKYDSINDAHLFHENYIEKLNFLDLFLTKLFKIDKKTVIDRYIKEFMSIKNTPSTIKP